MDLLIDTVLEKGLGIFQAVLHIKIGVSKPTSLKV